MYPFHIPSTSTSITESSSTFQSLPVATPAISSLLPLPPLCRLYFYKTMPSCPLCLQLMPVGGTAFAGISTIDLDKGSNAQVQYRVIPGDGSDVSILIYLRLLSDNSRVIIYYVRIKLIAVCITHFFRPEIDQF